MAHKSLLPDHVSQYIVGLSRETDVQRALRGTTARLPMARMQISADQGAFLAFLVRLMGAKKCIEVGTFTGYSALSVALALPDDGTLIACDVSEEWTRIAERAWREAGVSSKIDLRLAPATETLRSLVRDGGTSSFDFAFVDADKESYDDYYEQCLALLRRGGVVAFDNVLWRGEVTQPSDDPETRALRALNDKVFRDTRVDASLVSIGDGILLARKR